MASDIDKARAAERKAKARRDAAKRRYRHAISKHGQSSSPAAKAWRKAGEAAEAAARAGDRVLSRVVRTWK